MTTQQTSPLQAEKAFRSFLRRKGLHLKSLNLRNALTAAMDFRDVSRNDYAVVTQQGDGLAFSVGVGTEDRGTRFEITIDRLFRLMPEDEEAYRWPAVRLRMRLQYIFDTNVIEYLSRNMSSAGQSFATWSGSPSAELLRQVEDSDAFRTFGLVAPTEVRISLDERAYRRSSPTSDSSMEPWWGAFDVA